MRTVDPRQLRPPPTLLRDSCLSKARSLSSKACVTAQPIRHITPTEANIRLNFEMGNHVAFGVAVNRLGTDCKDRGEFPGSQQSLRSAQVFKNIRGALWR